MVPPNPVGKQDSGIRDTWAFPQSFVLLRVCRTLFLGSAVYQALFIAFSPAMNRDAAQRVLLPKYPLNRTLLTPNVISLPVLLITLAGAVFRLYTYAELGADFTFDLRVPSRLKTDGIYAWLQHPSYAAAILSCITGILWFTRLDGAIGLLAPEWARRYQTKLHAIMALGVTTVIGAGLSLRMMEEESMLQREFGAEWDLWHRSTARLIPGFF